MMKTLPLRLLALGFAAIALFALGSTQAQEVSVLKGHEIEKPIDIVAERLEVRDRENIAIFTGKVEANQGDLNFKADSITVYYETVDGVTNPTVERLDVAGSVKLESPSEYAEADWGVYDVKRRLVTLGGAVMLRRGGTVIRGQRIELDLETGITKFDSSGSQPQDPDGGRVRGQFKLPEKKKDKPNQPR
jgi:lipopolysaccharide export system protein LptA